MLSTLEPLIAENYLFRALLYGLIPALATSLGGLIGLVGLKTGEKWLDFGLSLSAGVMLGVSLYELLPNGIESSGLPTALLGVVLGVLTIAVFERFIPHQHLFKGYEGPVKAKTWLKSIYLIVFAIIIHNIPEGMAVGASSYIDPRVGLATAISIAIQDVPEGYAVSFPLSAVTRSKLKPLLIAALSGLSETVMAVLAALTASLLVIEGLMLSIASGAMLYIVSHEVIPETHRHGYETLATSGLVLGFIASIVLIETS